MCGIVGLFLKDKDLEPDLGLFLSDMLVKMSDRGPDSAGIALYSQNIEFDKKLTLKTNSFDGVEQLKKLASAYLKEKYLLQVRGNHIILSIKNNDLSNLTSVFSLMMEKIQIMSKGDRMEIFKEVGSPKKFVSQFDIKNFSGTHGVGHTRMATESAVSTMGAHPFSTGEDQCLVHNDSISNHNSVRRTLVGEGQKFETDNDSEVAASYLTWRMANGFSLESALTKSLDDLDGFFTFLVGTKNGFAVIRDRIACKPAVLAETDQYVAFGSEYRALTNLPHIDSANVWEPEPATVYFWKH